MKYDNVHLTKQYILDATVRKIHAAIKFLGSTKFVSKFEKKKKCFFMKQNRLNS